MIISASRRTDIPAYYSDWFFNRLAAGFVRVANPFNPRQIREVSLRPEDVDCFVFWSKNPAPLLQRLGALRDYKFYFQFTLNPYDKDVEPGLPEKSELLKTFSALAQTVGVSRVVWRYDPIVVSSKYSIAWHKRSFATYCQALAGKTRRVVISFVDAYRGAVPGLRELEAMPFSEEMFAEIAGCFAETAAQFGLPIESCCEPVDLRRFNIQPGRCVDDRIISELAGRKLELPRDRNQRPGCGCVASVDIGAYSTCPAGCRYCYANKGTVRVVANCRRHDPSSPFLLPP